MLKTLALTAVLVAAALPAAAQSGGPTPKEQVGMHTGTTTTNGSAVIVQDRNGTHPEGYPGMAVRNRTTGDNGPGPHHRHHRRHHRTAPPAG